MVDGRPSIVAETARSTPELQSYVGSELSRCLEDRFFLEALPTHFEDRTEAGGRVPAILERFRAISGLRG